MSFTLAGSEPCAYLHNTVTSSLTTQNAGDLIVLIVTCHTDGTNYCTGISDSNSLVAWTQATSPHDGSNANIPAGPAWTGLVWFGKVLSAGSTTVTFTYSGGAPTYTNATGAEFTVTSGNWAVDTWTYLDSSAGTSTWPSMTAAGSGELYLGYAWNFGAASVPGSNPDSNGFHYDANADTAGNGMAWNTSYPSGTSPVWADSSEAFGIMVLVQEVQPGGSSLVQAPYRLITPPSLPYPQAGSRLIVPAAASSSSTSCASTYDIIAGGAGSWANPANAEGAPDGSYATWTAP